ncbi:pyridoxamine 5'-phosphate oxidase family protein [Actinokineospora xionganensis]|uniref:Pyridoxamine 5'-phosphate oxidase family protein n=1 Tax=Actinokineospora xionganensis TaxID=2684470 RepID=A0ABR7L542_9PSEU|nr:pyridoxamine 5'-phosphate oxidase family protein [Actinokineospora xionganensis]MBC6447811.1 pyridoxamine 5'-phosphate oxidase family protein [Actinokineospora xionganensis]
MGKTHERIDGRLRDFIERQPLFFIATAPLGENGHVNLSPKGGAGSWALLDDRTFAYVDFGGSGAETIAHLRENGRVTVMWCAFDGPPDIVRVHGRGEPVFRDDPRWPDLIARIPEGSKPGARAIIVITADRISDSCGYGVPLMDYQGDRTLLANFLGRKTDAEFAAFCEAKDYVGTSLDGLPGLPLPLPQAP